MIFKNHLEIYSALINGKKIRKETWCNNEFIHLADGLMSDEHGRKVYHVFDQPLAWSLYEEPKKMKTVTLYRYTYQELGHFFQTPWRSMPFDSNLKLLKTEEKTIEIEDV